MLAKEGIMAAIFGRTGKPGFAVVAVWTQQIIHRLIVSLDGVPEESPGAIAKAWDEEIARRVADMEAGRTQWIPADVVMTQLREKIVAAKTGAN